MKQTINKNKCSEEETRVSGYKVQIGSGDILYRVGKGRHFQKPEGGNKS